MNRKVLGMAAIAFAFCSILSCSDKSSEVTGLALNDSTVSEARFSVKPGTVTDLQASVIGSTSVTLSFTQVNDGTGKPAKYDVRYAVAPISWGSAASTTSGTCTTPVAGTTIGSQLSCTVLGLTPATDYNFELVPYRGTLNLDAVFGSLSNTVSGATTASAGTPPAPVASVSVSPASSNLLIGATVQLLVTARDANNTVLTGRVVTSSSANPAIASVNSLGLVSAVGVGATQITVTSEGKSAVATITVAAPAAVPVASVTVSPSSSSLLIGATAQLSAATRDAGNNVLTGRVVTWSSANAAIATVSSSGLVRAVSAGTVQVTATSETKTGTATVNVQATPPPPPPGSTNEPAGMTLLNERPFNSLTESSGWITNKLTIAQDASAPKSPSSVIRATYPAGFSGGSSPGTAEFSHAGHRVIYISYWAKLSANFWGHLTGVNKQLYEWANGNGIFYFEAAGVGSGSLTPRVVLQGTPADAVLSPNLVPTARIPRGVWYHVEIVLNGNSSGSADGSVDWWLDGVHIASYSGRQFTSGATSWGIFQFQPVWGGVTDVVPATMTQDWDHLYISGKN